MLTFKGDGKLDTRDGDTKELLQGMQKHNIGLEVIEESGPGAGAADVQLHGEPKDLKAFFKDVLSDDLDTSTLKKAHDKKALDKAYASKADIKKAPNVYSTLLDAAVENGKLTHMEDDYGTNEEDLLDMANQAGVKLEFPGRDKDFNQEKMNTYGDKNSIKKFMNLIYKDKSIVEDEFSDVEENNTGGSSSKKTSEPNSDKKEEGKPTSSPKYSPQIQKFNEELEEFENQSKTAFNGMKIAGGTLKYTGKDDIGSDWQHFEGKLGGKNINVAMIYDGDNKARVQISSPDRRGVIDKKASGRNANPKVLAQKVKKFFESGGTKW